MPGSNARWAHPANKITRLTGAVPFDALGDKFGDGNKVVRIGAKSITYLDLDQSEVLIKLYNSPRNGELNEGS